MGVRVILPLIKIEIVNAIRNKVFLLLTLILPFIITSILVFGMTSSYEAQKINSDIKEVNIGFTKNIDNDLTYIGDSINSKYDINVIKTENYIKDLKEDRITVYIHLWENNGEKNIKLYADTSIKDNSIIVDSIKEAIYRYYDTNGEKINYQFVQQSSYSGSIDTNVRKSITNIIVVVIGYISLQIMFLAFYINSRMIGKRLDDMKIELETIPTDRMEFGVLKYLSSLSVLLISLSTNILGIVLGGLIAYLKNPVVVKELLRVMFLEQSMANIIVIIVGILITMIVYVVSVAGCSMYISAIKRWLDGTHKLLRAILTIVAIALVIVQAIALLGVSISIFDFDQFVITLVLIQLAILSSGLIFTCIAVKLLSSEKVLIGIHKYVPLIKKRAEIKKGGLPNVFYTILAFSIFEIICLFVPIPNIYQILAIVVSLGFTIYLKYDIKQTFSLRVPRLIHIIGAFCILIVFMVVGNILSGIMFIIFPTSQVAQSGVKLVMQSTDSVLGALLLIAILPGISEEMLCRGFMLSGFRATKDGKKARGKKAIIAVVITGIIFGAIHVELRLIPTLSLLGIVFGYCTYKAESLYIGIMMHIINNTYATLAVLTPNNLVIKGINRLGSNLVDNILVGIVVLIVTGTIGFIFINMPIKNKFNKND